MTSTEDSNASKEDLKSENTAGDDVHHKPHHDHHHHAHFKDPEDQDDFKAHDCQILIDSAGDDMLNVRLGFLQIKHIYEVKFSVEDQLGELVTFDPLENLNARIESANASGDGKGHDIVLTFNAVKEKLMKESIKLWSKDIESKSLTMVLQARVLGKGKGTPSLKKGIHCVKIEWDEESEASDWQGF